MSGPFFGGAFFGGGFFGTQGLGGAGFIGPVSGVPSWRESVQAAHEQRELERKLALERRSLKKVQLQIRAVEKKITVAQAKSPIRVPDGILANLHRLTEKREAIKQRIYDFGVRLADINTLLIASGAIKEQDDDEDDIEMLLLS